MTGDLGRLLIIFGVVLVGVGLLLNLAGKIPWLGKLPGDIYYKGDHVTLYVPLALKFTFVPKGEPVVGWLPFTSKYVAATPESMSKAVSARL